jgi:hypothetical protein
MEPGREIHERPPDLGSLYLSGCSAPHLATDDNVEHLVQGEPINKLLQPVRQMLSREEPTDSETASKSVQD